MLGMAVSEPWGWGVFSFFVLFYSNILLTALACNQEEMECSPPAQPQELRSPHVSVSGPPWGTIFQPKKSAYESIFMVLVEASGKGSPQLKWSGCCFTSAFYQTVFPHCSVNFQRLGNYI